MARFNPADAYDGGLRGAYNDPRADEMLVDSVIRKGGNPDGGEVAHQWEFADLGKGKLTATWQNVVDYWPGCWPGPPQDIGDCFPAGTMVRMADGSEKPIEEVVVGDSVQTPFGNIRPVIDTIKKPFSGNLVTINAAGTPRSVSCTPDHRFVAGGDSASFWCEADLLTSDTEVLIPRHVALNDTKVFDLAECPGAITKGNEGRNVPISSDDRIRTLYSTYECNRRIPLDSRLGWLVGLYLAEGSCDYSKAGVPRRITFNLGGHERVLAEIAVGYIKELFGVEASIRTVPSKPNVLYVRVSSVPFSWLMTSLGTGNTYSKRLNSIFFSATKATRLGVLRGYFAGDGSLLCNRKTDKPYLKYDAFKATAVSVSRGLIDDMFSLANSCGLSASFRARKARGRSKEASELHFGAAGAVAVFPGMATECGVNVSLCKKAGTHGLWKKAKRIGRESLTGDVYCIGVADDHAFVANGYAVHNCVSFASRSAALTSWTCELIDGRPDEVTGIVEGKPDLTPEAIANGVLSTEALFWWRGHDGDGWTCSGAANAMMNDSGIWLRKDYPEIKVDLTKYSGDTAQKWGARRPPDEVRSIGRQHLVRTATVLKSTEQIRDFLAAGYGVYFCSSLKWSSKRDENGFSPVVPGVWLHSQLICGWDERPEIIKIYGEPLALNGNSWGRNWNSGSRKVLGTNLLIPEGFYWTRASSHRQNTLIAVSSVNGWPKRKLKTYGAMGRV